MQDKMTQIMQSPYTQSVYPVDRSVADIDQGYEAEEVDIGNKSYFCGQIDPDYSVRWLYSDDGERVGCLEGENVLWFYDTEWGTYLQEDGWSMQDQSIWSRMTPAAYEECFRRGWTTIADLQKQTSVLLLQLHHLKTGELPEAYTHCKCGKTQEEKRADFTPFTVFCVDEDGVLYTPPSSTSLWKRLSEL